MDDYVDGLEMYGEFLAFHGYRVLLARSGTEAGRAYPPPLARDPRELWRNGA